MQRPERSRTEQPRADSALRPLPQSDTTLHTIEANHALNVAVAGAAETCEKERVRNGITLSILAVSVLTIDTDPPSAFTRCGTNTPAPSNPPAPSPPKP